MDSGPIVWDRWPWQAALWAADHSDVPISGIEEEGGVKMRDQPALGWTVVLRCQSAGTMAGQPPGGDANAFELRGSAGSYPIAAGVAAYENHVDLHDKQQP